MYMYRIFLYIPSPVLLYVTLKCWESLGKMLVHKLTSDNVLPSLTDCAVYHRVTLCQILQSLN